ncbi:hypothetical protein [Pseudanabaena sp. SR411]|nr:hypothetical protein [Pseudanabaena sp. SR411]
MMPSYSKASFTEDKTPEDEWRRFAPPLIFYGNACLGIGVNT